MSVVEVSNLRRDREHTRVASFPDESPVGQVSCIECGGSGWWGYGPAPETNGPCIDCKGTGRVWVGLL